MEDVIAMYKGGGDLLTDAKAIIETARSAAYRSVNVALVQRNWLLGKRIAEEELKGADRATYGTYIVKKLSTQLTDLYGSGFDSRSLYSFLQFFKQFPIVDSLSPQSGGLLSWTHYRKLLQVENKDALAWYINEAAAEGWGVRVLQRNISSQYYERMLLSQHKELVKNEMQEVTRPLQERLEFIKNPVVAEFLGFKEDSSFTESQLESRILDNIREFLMELGKGYAFVARQQHIHTEKEDYYIDLVFYNYILKCFVLIDLKTSKITHQDVGQMDMYVRMYDELKRGEGDNPTLGIVLCSDTDSDIARYSVLHGNEQLFASKYRLCLPKEEELRAEIEMQKRIFEEQISEK
jgi:predicted nuclease of restriction endonuclease-like (RecB) superfamily